MIRRVLVLGGGSAGFLAAITIKFRCPEIDVVVLRSPDIGIIGVGEATTLSLPQLLHGYLRMDIGKFFELAQPQWKLGIRFLWGKRPYFDFVFGRQLDTKWQDLPRNTGFYCREGPFDYVGLTSALMTHNAIWARRRDNSPYITSQVAYHLENETFVSFLEAHARQIGIRTLEDTVHEVQQDESGITGLKCERSGVVTADLFIDCSGFASLLLGKTLQEPFVSYQPSLFNDRAVVGGWQREEEPIQPYTTAETMSSGWCWRIDHEFRINRGYVFSSAFQSDADAEEEFRRANPKVKDTRFIRFRTGRYERAWVKNVVAVGNSSGFVEPLESTGLACIAEWSQGIAEVLYATQGHPTPTMIRTFNKRHTICWDIIRDFLAVHFKFNTRYDTPYWLECREKADLCGATPIVEYFQENGPSILWRAMLVDQKDQFGMEGYLSLLVGQQVPYHLRQPLSSEELTIWERIRAQVRTQAQQAYSVPGALSLLRLPHFRWPENLYVEGIGSRMIG